MSDTKKLFESFQRNLKESEAMKLTKDTRDKVEIGDILADSSNRYVVVDIINNPRSKAITVRDEKDWRPIYATPISNWYGTTIIKGPFIRKNGKVIKESENSELDKWWDINYEKAIDYVEKAGPEYIADLIYDGNTDMYYEQTAKHVALDLLHILGIKEFEEEINHINSLDESEELNSNLIKTYNVTDYGYHNNAVMVYGELNDGNWYVYIPDNEYLEVFNEPITQKYIDTAYNYDEDNDKSDDEWFDNFHKEHEIKYDKEDLLLRELNKRYFNLEDDEDEEE